MNEKISAAKAELLALENQLSALRARLMAFSHIVDELEKESAADEPSPTVNEHAQPAPAEALPDQVISEQAEDMPDLLEEPTQRPAEGARNPLYLANLRQAVGVNDRFVFANALFGGDHSAFNRALDELNHIASEADAQRIMNAELAPRFRWNEEDEATIQFRALVARRFL